ncbi:MAG: hypothetical protein JWM99_4357 [Verrucomicrobiales bacterium]|nr:hypothetical protein [Verrucomicrobiales bacterium]
MVLSYRIKLSKNIVTVSVRHYRLTEMKSVTTREFYHNASLVDGLPEGKQLVVTSKGMPKFIVTRTARPRMTSALARQRSVGDAISPQFDGVAFLRGLKK